MRLPSEQGGEALRGSTRIHVSLLEGPGRSSEAMDAMMPMS